MLRTLSTITLLFVSIGIAHAQNRGATMDQVRAQRGEPEQVLGPIGDPPITKWVYADDILYFEYKLLLNTVAKQNVPAVKRRDGLRLPAN